MKAERHGVERRRFRVLGVVQGVGFRPFVYGLADRLGLAGFVLNDGEGVLVEVEGDPEKLERFALELPLEAPGLARVDSVDATAVQPLGETEFRIAVSDAGGRSALIPPDVATCGDCLRELWDPADRRYRYPFVNCTQCGPRFTIVTAVPYDRPNTTMARFAMCADCRREYEDPADRRFHAEPIACPACGPQLRFEASNTVLLGEQALEGAVAALREGAVVAVKGLGGYHLACDAASEEAVARLRARKHREDKPFALMASDPAALAHVDGASGELLASRERPIVLVRRRDGAAVAPSVAPGTAWLGIMLPYTPLHHLLLEDFGGALVMTSGNRSDEPIAFEDEEARDRLAVVADAFLTHDRPIHRRCEDSVHHGGTQGSPVGPLLGEADATSRDVASPGKAGLRRSFPIRRSRGYVPSGLPLPVEAAIPILAVGAQLKSTFCVARGSEAFLSAHLGDLDSELAYRAFREDIELYLAMLGVEPEVVACDLHPDYLSTKWALEVDADAVRVQHHHAHAAACLAEHGEQGPALAVVFDGTGYGTDGTLWGGEILRCNLTSFERVASLDPVPLPGGEAAIREPWRVAAVHLERAGRPVPFERWPLVRKALQVNAPLSSGMGRLFDAVAAVLGVRREVTYEGQAAIELEHLAGETRAEPYAWRFGDGSALVRAAYDEAASGRPATEVAAAFHEAVAAATAAACAEAAGPRTVALSGGTFQNVRLLGSTRRRLEELGFRVLTHDLVPPNDGGISYGQAAVAAATLSAAA